jgi:RNA polymerase sigma-70 factor (ECF subfamily)
MSDVELPDELREQTLTAWRRYVDVMVPFRPELYRYCRSLTGNPWDAEDLVQDALLRGFGTLGSTHHSIDNARGYLVRIATNLWIDKTRHSRREESMEAVAVPAAGEPSDSFAVRDASATLLLLPPQERAAVLLKDIFEMTLEEIAGILSTTVGAVKAALHRGRERLRSSSEPAKKRQSPSPELVDRFIERLNAADLTGLLALMLDTAVVKMPGSLLETGRKQFGRKGSWLWQAVNVHPELPAELRPPKWANERASYHGEPVMISFMSVPGGPRVMQSVATFEESEGRIAAISSYVFSPEVVHEIAAELGVAVGAVFYQLPEQMRNPAMRRND